MAKKRLKIAMLLAFSDKGERLADRLLCFLENEIVSKVCNH
jgi:hypothetical protein